MILTQDGGRRTLAVLLFFCCVWLAPISRAQSDKTLDKDEEFEKVDPYTKGEDAALEKAGYVSFGPFLFAEKIRTQDVEEALGGLRVLWVETEHFKIGSTLRTYKLGVDPTEDDKIEAELKRLKPRLAKFPTQRNKLDPWLRLHLYAMRAEDLYADFCRRFGLTPADFDATRRKEGGPDMGPGPYLGMEMKYTLLLCDKQSSVGRFFRQLCSTEVKVWQRWTLPGSSMFLGMSAEALKDIHYERDADMHATVASELTMNLFEGFRQANRDVPFWFRVGSAHEAARRVDPRCVLSATGTLHGARDEQDHDWEPRVYGLVFNKAAVSWSDMLGWTKWEDLKPQSHLIAWSRVAWLNQRKGTDLRALLLALTEKLPQNLSDAERQQPYVDKQVVALQTVLGKPIAELEAEWKQWVLRSYRKK